MIIQFSKSIKVYNLPGKRNYRGERGGRTKQESEFHEQIKKFSNHFQI